MRLFSYKCKGEEAHRFDAPFNESAIFCPYHENGSDVIAKRDYSTVQLSRPTFVPHFNHTVGQHVNTSREFDDALKRASDAQSERTGMSHSYARLDPGDMPRPDDSHDIYETRDKFLRDNKFTDEAGKLVKPLPS